MGDISSGSVNVISSKNYRASATLTEGSTWTGTYESCISFNTISVVVKSTSVDKIGWLYIDFSRDATNAVQTFGFRIWDIELGKTITCHVKNAYFRLRFVCSTVEDTRLTLVSNTMSNVEIYTMLHMGVVKGDYEFGKQKVKLCGYDNAGSTKIIAYNAATTSANYPFPQTGCQVRIVNNCGNNGDLVSGVTGLYARQGIVVGVDTSNNEIYWRMSIVSANSGGGVSTNSFAIFTRVNDFRITLYGTAGTPELAAGGSIKVQINDSSYKDVTQLHYNYDWRLTCCAYTVPANYSLAKVTSVNYSTNNIGYAIRIVSHKRVSGTLFNLRKPDYILWFTYTAPKDVCYPDGIGHSQPGDMFAGVTVAAPNVFTNIEAELECG